MKFILMKLYNILFVSEKKSKKYEEFIKKHIDRLKNYIQIDRMKW